MANVKTAADFSALPGGLASRLSGRVDVGTLTGDSAQAAPTLITDGVPFYRLPRVIVPWNTVAGSFTINLWAGYVPNDGLPGAIRWVKVVGAAEQAAVTGQGGWALDCGRPDRIAIEVAVVGAGTFQAIITGAQN